MLGMGYGYGYGQRARIERWMMTMTHSTTAYEEYCKRGRAKYGSKFNGSGLAEKFVSYYNSGERITVGFVGADGKGYEVKTGTVSATNGWAPSFVLMATKRSTGSGWLISDRDLVLKDGDFRAEVYKARVEGLKAVAVAVAVAVAEGRRPVEPLHPDQAERAGKFGVMETDWAKMTKEASAPVVRVRAQRKQRVREMAAGDGVATQLNMFA